MNFQGNEMENEDKLLAFKIFCLESYKAVHKLTGKTAFDLFNKYQVFEYIESTYDVLHSTGRLYIVSDIDEYIGSLNELKKSVV